MGNYSSCCGSRKASADRARGWAATGIVGLRDQKLKVDTDVLWKAALNAAHEFCWLWISRWK